MKLCTSMAGQSTQSYDVQVLSCQRRLCTLTPTFRSSRHAVIHGHGYPGHTLSLKYCLLADTALKGFALDHPVSLRRHIRRAGFFRHIIVAVLVIDAIRLRERAFVVDHHCGGSTGIP
jgi:hypothetical protein